jgi:hypothetical protein
MGSLIPYIPRPNKRLDPEQKTVLIGFKGPESVKNQVIEAASKLKFNSVSSYLRFLVDKDLKRVLK